MNCLSNLFLSSANPFSLLKGTADLFWITGWLYRVSLRDPEIHSILP